MNQAILTYAIADRRTKIGRRVRESRERSNWTQQEVADFLHCARQRVSRVESGLTDFSPVELGLLAQEWKVTLNDFFCDWPEVLNPKP